MEAFADKPTLWVTGRAAAALYLLLRVRFPDRCGEVVLPANICHAAVYPVLHAGLTPVLCDVDVRSGNTGLEYVERALTPQTRAVVLPHMYGCPVSDTPAIADLCRKNGLVLVEDCASALGADGTGLCGDDVLYSTGHAKTVDLGWGGVLCTDLPVEALETHVDELFPDSEESRLLEKQFGQHYRAYINSVRPFRDYPHRDFFDRDFRCIHLRLPPPGAHDLPDRVRRALPAELSRRRRREWWLAELFRSSGCESAGAAIYVFPRTAAPWRFSFFVPPERRPSVVSALLGAGLPVSDWYPSNADFFGSTYPAPNAEIHGRSILNLPLAISDDDARRAFEIVAATLEAPWKGPPVP